MKGISEGNESFLRKFLSQAFYSITTMKSIYKITTNMQNDEEKRIKKMFLEEWWC